MTSTLINNQWITGEGETLASTTPDERKVLWEKTSSSAKQVHDAVASARLAEQHWSSIRLSDRIGIIQKFATILNEQKEELAEAIHLETGKPKWEALTEVGAMANKVAISIKSQKERAGYKSNNHLRLQHHAHGVMAVFGPFNFPGHLPNGHIVPALLAGNTVVFKPSELTPWVAELTLRAWMDAGLPEGVINLVQGGADVGKALVDADVNGILFTGSYQTGKLIHQQLAGRPEILLALEMGGNNALIVSDIHNSEVAANTILHSAFLSAGQRCTCTRRLILIESNQTDTILENLINLCKRIILATPSEAGDAFMGPVINKPTADRLVDAEQQWLQNGGKALLKMSAVDNAKVYLTPGIIDMTQAENVEDEELFGPLLQVYRVKSFDDALALANQTKYGLAAGLISDSPTEHEHFQQKIRAGVVSINLPTAGASSELPFGGIGASGNHRPSAYYAADYCAWPQATSHGADTQTQAEKFDTHSIRGLR